MRSAAVGFQCPSCVKEGLKGTRSGQGRFGGAPSGNPTLTSQVLIGLNALVYLLILATGGSSSRLVNKLALLPLGHCASVANPDRYVPGLSESACHTVPGTAWASGVATGAPWQLLTSVFTHVAVLHIAFNMLALWVLGPQLEAILGRARFLAVYLVSGLVGSALVYWLSDPTGSTLGASGAIFGLMGALLVLVIRMGGQVNQVVVWIGINFVFTVLNVGSISWQGHVGGFLGGVALTLLLIVAPRNRRALWQWLAVALVLAGVVAAVVARTAVLPA